jgi:hypothetical protein
VVEDLGRRLFTDRLGPLTFYPMGCGCDEMDNVRSPSTSHAGDGRDDPDRAAALMLPLQSTLPGCEWMRGESANLTAVLEQGQPWHPSDRLKSVRLLGKQPFDTLNGRSSRSWLVAVLSAGRKGFRMPNWEVALSGKHRAPLGEIEKIIPRAKRWNLANS